MQRRKKGDKRNRRTVWDGQSDHDRNKKPKEKRKGAGR